MRRALIAVLLAIVAACSAAARPNVPPRQVAERQMVELWREPADLKSRDLFYGPGGRDLAPQPGAVWRYKNADTAGYSPGFDVVDAEGREWDVKLGLEAQSEVVASRVLWAVGYHQPPTYFVSSWRIAGAAGVDDDRPQPSARFRASVPGMDVNGEWSWQDNPFVGTQPFRGLLVLNIMINNWDLKGTNNRVYEATESAAAGSPRRWFVVRDLGASFGKFRRFPFGTRNNVADFEGQAFIDGVSGGRVKFAYRGRHEALLQHITPDDVVWVCERLARLTDGQWDDMFRAAGYPDDVKARFIATLRRKVGEGLSLRGAASR